ncbi:unnamed protein product, partial [Polarella glacialis]
AGRSALETLVQDAVARERASREAAFEQMASKERQAKAAQSDQASDHEHRLSSLRSQFEELSERLRADLAAKCREWTTSTTRSSEASEAHAG